MGASVTVNSTEKTGQIVDLSSSHVDFGSKGVADLIFDHAPGAPVQYLYSTSTGWNGIQNMYYWDLSDVPKGAKIISASIVVTKGSGNDSIFNSIDVGGTKSVRLVGPGNASATFATTDWTVQDNTQAALFDLIPYDSVAGTYNATALGIAYIQTWLISDAAVKVVGQPESFMEGYDYFASGGGATTGWQSEGMDNIALTVNYEMPGAIAALGCNF